MLERRMPPVKKGPTPEELLEIKRKDVLKQQSERMDMAPQFRVTMVLSYLFCCPILLASCFFLIAFIFYIQLFCLFPQDSKRDILTIFFTY